MPMYEVKCDVCGQEFEFFTHHMGGKPCRCENPKCKSKSFTKLFSNDVQIRFKGKGWTKRFHGDIVGGEE